MELHFSQLRHRTIVERAMAYIKSTGRAVPLLRYGRVVAFLTPALEAQPAPIKVARGKNA